MTDTEWRGRLEQLVREGNATYHPATPRDGPLPSIRLAHPVDVQALLREVRDECECDWCVRFAAVRDDKERKDG